MRHFAHNIGDYAAATAHLTFIEDAAYHRLLRRYYQDEKPLLPDVAAVCRLVGARGEDERQAVVNVLAEFFVLEDDGYHQGRADRELETYQAKAKAARENGTKGGRPVNREKTKLVSENNQTGKLTTRHSPLTTRHSPLTTPHHLTTDFTVTPAAPAKTRESGSRSLLIDEKWLPSEADVTGLRNEIPWLVGELYESRQRDFWDWCAANATRSFNPAATWRGFMRRTKQPRENVETFDQRRIRECLKVINDC